MLKTTMNMGEHHVYMKQHPGILAEIQQLFTEAVGAAPILVGFTREELEEGAPVALYFRFGMDLPTKQIEALAQKFEALSPDHPLKKKLPPVSVTVEAAWQGTNVVFPEKYRGEYRGMDHA